MKAEKCKICGAEFVSNGCGTGYGINENGEKICYSCCGKADAEKLEKDGILSGYFSDGFFTNWPGTFKIKVQGVKKSWHNFAGRNGRRDFWLTYKGQNYHGVNVGNNQCATIRRVK